MDTIGKKKLENGQETLFKNIVINKQHWTKS